MVVVTGKAGYIGSYLEGYGVDDLSIGKRQVDFVADVRDVRWMKEVLQKADVVVHLAAVKRVDESESDPMKYWDRNFVGTLRLCEAMQAVGVSKIVFASSAAVYGSSPYGQSKLACEQLLERLPIQAAILRLFNVGGGALMEAKNSGLVTVFGNDYETRDGTCERDYIAPEDVAEAINRSINYLRAGGSTFTADIGTGRTTTVLEAVQGCEVAMGPRRAGDIPVSVADVRKAKAVLGFEAKRRVF